MILDMTIWVSGFAAALCVLCFIIWRYTVHRDLLAERERDEWDTWIFGEHQEDQEDQEEGEPIMKPLTGFQLYLLGRYAGDLCPICGHSPGIHDNYKHAAHDAAQEGQQ